MVGYFLEFICLNNKVSFCPRSHSIVLNEPWAVSIFTLHKVHPGDKCSDVLSRHGIGGGFGIMTGYYAASVVGASVG